MELEVLKPNRIDEVQHLGKIIAIKERSKPFEYLDLVIETEPEKRILTAGYPKILMKDSKLGLLLTRFGAQLEEGKKIDPEQLLKNRNCTFITMNETTNRGTFPKVIPESMKPR